MKKLRSFVLTSLFMCLIATNSAFAFMDVTQPDITSNVHVVRHATAAQCPASWNGSVAPENVTIISGLGMNDVGTVGVQSCVRCTIQQSSGDCVCAKCYGYFN